MPVKTFFGGEVPCDPLTETPERTSGVDVCPSGERKRAEPADPDPGRVIEPQVEMVDSSTRS